MARLIIEKDDTGLHAIVQQSSPSLTRQDDCFHLRFDIGGDSFTAVMTPAELQALGLQCIAHMPSLMPQVSVASVEEAIRYPARRIKELDDRSIQILLRECQSDVLVDFFWYMKDADLIKLVLRNMSQRAAEMLMDDLDRTWRGKNPDSALEAYARRGREAVTETMTIVRRLIDEGQIPDVETSLTTEEIDALLAGVAQ